MAIAWPSNLPAPQKRGLTIGPNVDTLSRETQSGRKYGARYGIGGGDSANVNFLLFKNQDENQVKQFELYYAQDLNMGINFVDASWLSSVMGYSDHYFRVLGYTPGSIAGVGIYNFSLTILIKKKDDCPEDVFWPYWE